MREKILAKLKEKFPGLPQNFLGLFATQLAVTVTEETAIEGAITELDKAVNIQNLSSEFQKDGDRRVTEAKKKWEEEKPKPGKDKSETDDSGKGGKKDEPDPMLAEIRKLTEKIEKLERQQTTTTLSERLNKALTEKKIPLVLGKGRVPAKEEDFDTVVSEIETDYQAMKQEQANNGFSQTTAPAGGEGSVAVKATGKEDTDIKNWSAAKKAAAPKAAV